MAITSFVVMLSGCNGGSEKDLKNCDDYVYVDSLSNTHVYGVVRDVDGNALDNVLVTSGTDTVVTSENGAYSLEKCRAVNGRCVVRFEEHEYFSVVRTANIVNGEARVDAILMPQDSKEGVSEVTRFYNSEGSTIKVGNMQVVIPANALVYKKDGSEFNGSVFASAYYLNPNSETFTKEMPGGDMSGVTADGKDVILLSYGMVEVSLKDSADQKLQLKEGVESTLTFPIPEGFKEEQKYEKIPLWYFDEEKGTWIEEGIATKNGDSYTGNVKHFSWYNLDWPSVRATIKGRVTNKDGKPLPNVLVTVSQTSAYTDTAGYYSVYVPCNTPVFVTVKPKDYGGYKNCPIHNVAGLDAGTVYTQDIVLPDMPYIHGKVIDKYEQPICGLEITTNKATTITNSRGEYGIYCNSNEPFTLAINTKTILNGDNKYQTYEFKNSWEIDEEKSYDFVIDKPITVFGSVRNSNYTSIKKNLVVTVIVDKKEYKIEARNYYCFRVPADTKEITTYVKAKDGNGLESNRAQRTMTGIKWTYMPTIYIPTGISISGFVVNSCGPSKAKITVESGRGKNKLAYSQSTTYGYFDIDLPLSMNGSSVKVKINCCGKRVTKKLTLDKKDVYLGKIEVCFGNKPDPDCIYAIIGDKTVKFDTKKDKFTEMFQTKCTMKKFKKYQAWYKSPDYDGMLILENVESSISSKNELAVYLLTDKMSVAKNYGRSSYVSGNEKNVYTFKTDYEMYVDGDDEDIYLYGSADVEYKNIDQEKLETYIAKSVTEKAENILVGASNTTEFYTLTFPIGQTAEIEKNLRNKGFKEKTTFLDEEQRVSTIFLQDNAEALIHRNKDKTSDLTVLVRDGIGNEPLYTCWKVDFRNSSLKKQGDSNISYMWKNEADIAQLVMFGPIMGIKFTKTDITEDKCGCSTQNTPAIVAKK